MRDSFQSGRSAIRAPEGRPPAGILENTRGHQTSVGHSRKAAGPEWNPRTGREREGLTRGVEGGREGGLPPELTKGQRSKLHATSVETDTAIPQSSRSPEGLRPNNHRSDGAVSKRQIS